MNEFSAAITQGAVAVKVWKEVGSEQGESPADLKPVLSRFAERYGQGAAWLATDAMVEIARIGANFRLQGAALPLPVLGKLYRDNARRWYGLPSNTG